jgi:hypothetical protein
MSYINASFASVLYPFSQVLNLMCVELHSWWGEKNKHKLCDAYSEVKTGYLAAEVELPYTLSCITGTSSGEGKIS